MVRIITTGTACAVGYAPMFRFLPWKSIVRRAARAYGIADPALWLARIRSFAQPSEVAEPIELLRAGILFHARGIVNTKAIQHNLDWVWPYWVQRQFDPNDVSFIPRAFRSATSTSRTATGRRWACRNCRSIRSSIRAGCSRRSRTAGRSTSGWCDSDGKALVPSRLKEDSAAQTLLMNGTLAVETTCRAGSDCASSRRQRVELQDGEPVVEIEVLRREPGRRRAGGGDSAVQPGGCAVHRPIAAIAGREGWFA